MTDFHNKPNIQIMFDSLAPTYDKINGILSLGLHIAWNNALVSLLGETNHLLDLCAGTGRVALSYVQNYPRASATLVDFSTKMLENVQKRHPSAPFSCITSDVTHLPLPDNTFRLASMAYGLRNLSYPLEALREVYRVLQPGGHLGILELTRPATYNPVYLLHKLYLNLVVPSVGRFYSGNSYAYSYLKESIRDLPRDAALEAIFHAAHLRPIRKRKLLFGTATIWILEK
ncbi:bifunctional demethylmenaquinone methyltransferase/2-methoxy-6-polyprenyl-1,4-benzoquinol methylase UbiE [Chlamydia trachomatis]|uniref:bifunctional demethylmenaquinone methyltransferase/2-methoxy-6-polyprenyl-1,4-benzoquinol methylase UbiE n=1 Tax=Chlamydia trachomatis TaxID=813 RepID=UPI00059EB176|nr:bifunctional demethylmenaquinone methyltransferase/2-methoxy-6-polyprenyl-1,4-benzoquinol methylase UbiE [Chlamydia trachomatis]ATW10209.1 bifunctional demethylmenaquinone methyltransferase/2-methoxy-6-polyprenyl-1,4-benzoquinol methylase [Chlamydia trachomatis]ATW11115.1 bifunctional demethylmenaquinone methyltransferase/2-methoxy-6-polyprenyl-1,4-benzoquinol methylase [Chlamydia trachomatis]ATW12010.1 bifunctional demethylmenaquinone methyltransferase/2-methoxy-6-polyprenyl-1,4-benzoquinol 